MTLHHGDCLDVMAGMDPESVAALRSKVEAIGWLANELTMPLGYNRAIVLSIIDRHIRKAEARLCGYEDPFYGPCLLPPGHLGHHDDLQTRR